MAKAVAKKEERQMTFADERPDWMNDSGRGQENVGLDDLTIPRLDVIQDLSPQRKKNDPAYIEGADSGMLFNTVTGKLYGDKVFFVPVYFRKEWLIWKQQSAGGGLHSVHQTKEEAMEAWNSEGLNENEYEIVDHNNHFGIVFTDDSEPEEIVISMTKSKAKASRQLNTLVKMVGGDRFSRAYKITAIEDQNKQGQTFYNIKVIQMGYVSEKLYKLGEKMYESISSSNKKVNYNVPAEEEAEY